MRLTRNKKGEMEQKPLSLFIAIIIGGILLIWGIAFMIDKFGATNQGITEAQSCSTLSIGNGVCRENCETDELSYPGFGCEGVENTCCVSTTKNEMDVILPAGYGGNADYNFKIEYIGIAKANAADIGQCQFDNKYNTSMRCVSGQRIIVPVKIAINNTGAKALGVKSKPIMVMNDNPQRISQQYISSSPTPLSPGETKEIQLDLVLTESNTVENSYYKIYPYALCDDDACRATDQSADRGVLRKINGDGTYLTIKFVKALN